MSDKGLTGQRDLKKMTALAKSTADLWGLTGAPKLLGNSENFVFEIDGHILRITEEYHRNSKALMAELDFVENLSDADVSVACPLRSKNKALVFLPNSLFNYLLAFVSLYFVLWEKNISHGIVILFRKQKTHLFCNQSKIRVRQGDKDTCTITAIFFKPTATPVIHA